MIESLLLILILLFIMVTRLIEYRKGATRQVFLTKKYAIKIPSFYNWQSFLNGILCNISEIEFSTLKDLYFCPVVWKSWLGLVVVMPRCREPNQKFFRMELEHTRSKLNFEEFYFSDCKINNYGYLGHRLVKIDYGN